MSIFNFNLQFIQSQLQQKPKNGFLLFEIGVLLIFITLTSLIIMSWFCRMVTDTTLSKLRLEAILYGSNLVEQFYLNKSSTLNIEKDKKYKVNYKIYNDSKLPNYRHLYLNIEWANADKKEHLVFQTGKVI